MHHRTLFTAVAAFGLIVAATAVAITDRGGESAPGEPGSPSPARPDNPLGWGGPADAPPEPGEPDEPTGAPRCAADRPAAEATSQFDGGTLSASLSHEMIDAGRDSERYAVIDIKTEPTDTDARPPLNVALLIDRSGSMNGDPIRQARRAARGVVERLGPEDRVSITTYDTRGDAVLAPTAVTPEAQANIADAIDDITPRGMTNIHEGLSIAYDQLREAQRDGALSRVIHLSDGQANQGVTSTPKMVALAQQASTEGIRTTSVGLGLQYNETLMEALADAGSGGYYFVGDPSDLDPVFAGELRDLEATVATQATLTIAPRCPGVRVKDVIGVPTERDGDALVAQLADIAGGEARRFVVELEVTGPESVGAQNLIAGRLDHEHPGSGTASSTEVELAATVTDDEDATRASVSEEAMAEVLTVKEAHALHEAALAYRGGRYDEASGHVEDQAAALDRAVQHYGLSDDLAGGAGARMRDFGDRMDGATPGSPEAEADALGSAEEARSLQRTRR